MVEPVRGGRLRSRWAFAFGASIVACSSNPSGDDSNGNCIANTSGFDVVNESGIGVHIQAADAGFFLAADASTHQIVAAGKTSIVVSENRTGYPLLESVDADFRCGTTHHFTVLPFAPVELAVTVGLLPNLGGEIGYGVVTSTPAGIDCSNDGTSNACAALFPRGTSVSLTLSPDPGSRLDPSAANLPTTYVLEQDTTAQASFVPGGASIAVATVGGGTVRFSPPGTGCSACGSDGAFYVNGTDVTLDAVPEQGASFVGFSGACTGPTCSIHVDGTAHAVTATFVANDETIAIAKTGTGTGTVRASVGGTTVYTCGATCTGTVSYGDDVTLDATPDPGSSFKGWSGGCAIAPTDSHCVFQAQAATTITAEFDSP